MAKFNFVSLLLLGVVLGGAAMLAPFAAANAQPRIGVTQATEGEPRGRPPGGADRVLRVGTDVQANEVILTASNDRAHLIFLDGTTLTVGPNAQLTIDKFVYDPDSKKGELAINASKGVFRLIGGRISKTAAITVTTPSSTMGIRGGIMIFGVEPTQTTSIFVYGDSMTVTAGGQTQTVTTPGLSVSTTSGSTPGAPTIAVQGSLAAAMGALQGNPKAAAALVTAINSVVASNLNNAAVLATITGLIQTAIDQYAPTTIGTAGTTLIAIIIVALENQNQTQLSPN